MIFQFVEFDPNRQHSTDFVKILPDLPERTKMWKASEDYFPNPSRMVFVMFSMMSRICASFFIAPCTLWIA